MHSCQEVVLLIVQHIIAQGDTRCHQFGNASFYKFLREFGVFELIADSHTFSSTDEFGQIGIKGMMGESGHLIAFHTSTIITMGEGDTKYLRSGNGIFAIGLVEVATSEQHHCVRMFRFQIEELFHHRGQFFPLFLRHYLSVFIRFFTCCNKAADEVSLQGCRYQRTVQFNASPDCSVV